MGRGQEGGKACQSYARVDVVNVLFGDYVTQRVTLTVNVITMPDGFDPHVELDRIYNLREMMQECRARASVSLRIIDEIFADPEVSHETKLRAIAMVWERGYGKARQHVYISEGTQLEEQRVKVYLPDNGRSNAAG